MNVPGLTEQQIELVKKIIPQGVNFKIFGSRANGKHRPSSDLDICILSAIPRSLVTQMHEQFEESNLPFTVDIVLLDDCDPAFQQIILRSGIDL